MLEALHQFPAVPAPAAAAAGAPAALPSIDDLLRRLPAAFSASQKAAAQMAGDLRCHLLNAVKTLLADAQRVPASGAAGLAGLAVPAEGDLAAHLALPPLALNSARVSDAAAGWELRFTLQGLLNALLGLESVEDGMWGASAPPRRQAAGCGAAAPLQHPA